MNPEPSRQTPAPQGAGPRSLTQVPTLPGRVPLIGHLLQLWLDPLAFLQSVEHAGDIVRVDLGCLPVYFLTTPDLVHQALVTHARVFGKGRFFERARAALGDGLATTDSEVNARQRRLVQPALHRTRITAVYAQVMERRARSVAMSWQPDEIVRVDRAMHELTAGIVAESLFSSGLSQAALDEVWRSLQVLSRGVVVRAVAPAVLDRLPIPLNSGFSDAGVRLRRIIDEVIRHARTDGAGRDDLLTKLLEARDTETGEAMTDAEIRDQLITLLLAGTETTATTLAWVFHELARHPDVEARVQAEVDEVVGSGPVNVADLHRLQYLDRVLQEVTRLYALVLITRKATSTVTLGGVTFPAGTEVAYSQYALHRDPRTYPDPERFDPDRWLPSRSSQGTPIPFGKGKYKCPGEAFARAEMLISVATITARWRLVPAPGSTVKPVLAEMPRPNALPMIAVPRQTVPRTPQPRTGDPTVREESDRP
ncbi:cytochrome P450 [Kitasatospora sp. NPDC086801]|uniref:cytochrome P450 n=1 Tax=Kitasatospora sp. NPDC086801 TaxID=3364066 RepID=UPI0038138D92